MCYHCFTLLGLHFLLPWSKMGYTSEEKICAWFYLCVMKQKLFSCFDKGIFDSYCNLNVFVWNSWASALPGGSIAQGRSGDVSLPWYSPHLSLSLPLRRLIGWFCSDLPGPGMHLPSLTHFCVQANWQWRVPSFCSINISFLIWMQIRDLTPRIQMGCLSLGK